MKLHKLGGFGSLVNALIMIIFLVINTQVYDPLKGFDAISASLNSLFIIYLGVILSGIAYIPIILALRERMQDSVPNLMHIAVIGIPIICALWFAGGLIGLVGMPLIVSAKDPSAYRAVGIIIHSLFNAGDFATGWVLLLIGWAALKVRNLPRILSYLFVLKGLAMILTFAVAPLVIVGILLGLVFYPWLGIVLLRSKS